MKPIMATLCKMSPDEAFKDISSVMVELDHNLLMVEFECENPTVAVKKSYHCVLCERIKEEGFFQKIFQDRDEGICRECFRFDPTEEE